MDCAFEIVESLIGTYPLLSFPKNFVGDGLRAVPRLHDRRNKPRHWIPGRARNDGLGVVLAIFIPIVCVHQFVDNFRFFLPLLCKEGSGEVEPEPTRAERRWSSVLMPLGLRLYPT